MPVRFLTATWRDLAILNFTCNPDLLKPLVPKHCVLDDWQGQHVVSLVAFLFLETKIHGVAIPWHRHFEEINLRFYVKRWVEGQWQRGVVFIREIVPRFFVAQIANWLYNENYVACPTRHQHTLGPDQTRTLRYAWDFQNTPFRLELTTDSEARALSENSWEDFILEHYYGYTRQRNHSTLEYEVRHPRWKIFPVHSFHWSGNADVLYGSAFAEILSKQPHSAICAEGSAVEVYKGRFLP